MKRKLMGAALFLCGVLCLTGCGGGASKLTCTINQSGVDATINANFDGNKVKDMSLRYDMDLSSYSDSQISLLEKQDYCKSIKASMSQFELSNCKQDISGKALKVTADIDISKMSDSDLTGSPSETKKALEKMGFSCK